VATAPFEGCCPLGAGWLAGWLVVPAGLSARGITASATRGSTAAKQAGRQGRERVSELVRE